MKTSYLLSSLSIKYKHSLFTVFFRKVLLKYHLNKLPIDYTLFFHYKNK